MPASALPLSLAIGLSACGPRLADRNIDVVNRLYEQAEKSHKDLTTKEVEAVLGQPTRVETFAIEMQRTRDLPVVRYYYQQGDQTVVLHFVDNKLSKHVGHFGETPAPEESEQRRMMPRQTPPGHSTPTPDAGEKPATPPPPSRPN
jgi:hypothetical protein